MTGAIFDEDGISVDGDFVRVGTISIKTSEITKVQLSSYRSDGHVEPVVWTFAFLVFIVWIAAPGDNLPVLPFLAGLVAFGFYKHSNPKPTRYRVVVGTGSILNTSVLDTTDEEQAARLQNAIEAAMSN